MSLEHAAHQERLASRAAAGSVQSRPAPRPASGAAARPIQRGRRTPRHAAAPRCRQTTATPQPAAPKRAGAPRSLDLGPCRPDAQGPSPYLQAARAAPARTHRKPEFLFREGDSVWAERYDIKGATGRSSGTSASRARRQARSSGTARPTPGDAADARGLAPARPGRRSWR